MPDTFIHISEMLSRNARMYPDDIALVERIPAENKRQEITWMQFDEGANRFANLLMEKLEGDDPGAAASVYLDTGEGESEKWQGEVLRLLSDLDPLGRMARLIVTVATSMWVTSKSSVPSMATGSTPLLLRFQEFGQAPGLMSISTAVEGSMRRLSQIP